MLLTVSFDAEQEPSRRSSTCRFLKPCAMTADYSFAHASMRIHIPVMLSAFEHWGKMHTHESCQATERIFCCEETGVMLFAGWISYPFILVGRFFHHESYPPNGQRGKVMHPAYDSPRRFPRRQRQNSSRSLVLAFPVLGLRHGGHSVHMTGACILRSSLVAGDMDVSWDFSIRFP